MPGPFEYATAPVETVPPGAYGHDYFVAYSGRLWKPFDYIPERDIPRAEAIAQAVGLQLGDQILDFGCGPGAMTAAFNAAGYPTIGVDFSPHAINNAVPEAHGRVIQLGGRLSLSDLPNDMVRLVFAKDVFEHLPESNIHEIVDELTCIGQQVLAIIPTTDESGSFIDDRNNRDQTHVTRLTRQLWLGRFAYETVLDLEQLADLVRSKVAVEGTLCMLLEESDTHLRTIRMRERVRAHTPMWRQLFGLPPRQFDVSFASLLSN